jgi:hypothetical protein
MDPMGRRRTTSLLVLLAHLGGVSWSEAAELLRVSSDQLERYVHGEISVPKRKFEYIMTLGEVFRYVHRVLEPSATNRWLHTPIPALGDQSPMELTKRPRTTLKLLEYVKSYTEPMAYL